jgi:hypothetical protein
MIDMLGNEIKINDIVVFASNHGWLSFAVVDAFSDKKDVRPSLSVIKRGYRNGPFSKELRRPHDVLVATEQVLSAANQTHGRPEEVQFVIKWRKEHATE